MKNKKHNRIAVVGMACRYPDADHPQQLWENILAGRVSFRKIPAVRLADAYFSYDASDPDATYSDKAAVLKNYSFPRENYKISKSVFDSTDFAHWLALDVATEAIEHTNFPFMNEHKALTGVFVGNSLTGEFSRANLLRLRWPYVSKILIKELQDDGWEHERIEKFIIETEAHFKSPFPPMTEDSLAGGLSNTIAGRICNYYDFNGGGYTVDGACSSSLLAVSSACNALASGDLTIALAGGVDISLDPFELVGFSRVGALAKKRMLVYDKNSAGFLPGEGCGFVVLMRYKDAVKHHLTIHAVINGWGISSDGQGGLTRPTAHGQLLAFDRAYEKAGYPIDHIGYIEGHGTGTKVGDETEIKTIAEAIRLSGEPLQPVFLGSVKANIGHTKAAAGIAGLLKSILCLENQIIPPATGNRELHPLLKANDTLSLPREGRLWPENKSLSSSVSSMGFGGINTHVTLSSVSRTRKKKLTKDEKLLLSSSQSAELFLFSAHDAEHLSEQIQQVLNYSPLLSFSELIDLSFALFEKAKSGADGNGLRAAVVADEPGELTKKLNLLLSKIETGNTDPDLREGIFFSSPAEKHCRIGLLFPGQGTLQGNQQSFIHARFPDLKNNYFDSLHDVEVTSAKNHQTAVVNHSIESLALLKALDIRAEVAIGHSLGELSALFWSGAYSLVDLTAIVKFRGELMTQCKGSMLSVNSDTETVKKLMEGNEISLACINTNSQLVLSGSDEMILSFQQKLKENKIASAKLNVSGAFHSPLMKPVQEPFGRFLKNISFHAPKRKIISTVLGRTLGKTDDIPKMLVDQFLSPVQFVKAVSTADALVDFWVETGSGKTLSTMVSSLSSKPALAMDSGSNEVTELLKIVCLNFCLSKEYLPHYLFKNRFHRDFDLDWKAEFLANPCENLVVDHLPLLKKKAVAVEDAVIGTVAKGDFLASFKEILSHHLDLSSSSLDPKARMLDDLHLNSITVGQLFAQASKRFNIPLPKTPTEYSNATIEEIALYFESVAASKEHATQKEQLEPSGLKDWVREFTISLKEDSGVLQAVRVDANADWNEVVSGNLNDDIKGVISSVKSLPGKGIVAALYSEDDQDAIHALVRSIQLLKENKEIEHFVVIQRKNTASGFAKSIFLEKRKLKVTVITIEGNADCDSIKNDVLVNSGFSEVIYRQGKRYVPELKLIEKTIPSEKKLFDSGDVVLVTGGGKGITSECAFALAVKTKCRLLITGRSDRNKDDKLNSNLKRFDAAGINYLYEIADIENTLQLKSAISKAELHFGKITAIIHGAGVNIPVSFTALDVEKINRTVSPKVEGLKNCLSILQYHELKSLVTFGSIIGSSGMHGNADYALANEWLRNTVEKFQSLYPGCKCMNLEWSVWSGSGMGEKLNVLEQLIDAGISPISLDHGVNEFLKLVESDLPSVNVVVAGRFGNLPTLSYRKDDLPLLRFLEDIKVHYPSIEIVSDFILSGTNDPYLNDHQLDGTYVFPGVMGLEAMMQAASVLIQKPGRYIRIRDVEFLQPVLLRPDEKIAVRILAVKTNRDEIEASVRCEQTAFAMNHFTATFSFSDVLPKTGEPENNNSFQKTNIRTSEVYDQLLFHTGRFKCLKEYTSLSPYSCHAIAIAPDLSGWYRNYFSAVSLLGNPAIHDACLHAVQACVPAYTLLPVSVREINLFDHVTDGTVHIEANELYRDHDIFCYDIVCRNPSGTVLATWHEVKFSILKSSLKKKLNLAFAKLVLQRKSDELANSKIEINFNPVSEKEPLLRRADGKPFLSSGSMVSVSNLDETVMTVKGNCILACDMEIVNGTSQDEWNAMLGNERTAMAAQLANMQNESFSLASTRVWGAMECLKKSGDNLLNPFSFDKSGENGFVIFKSGDSKIISYSVFINEYKKETVFSVLVNDEEKL